LNFWRAPKGFYLQRVFAVMSNEAIKQITDISVGLLNAVANQRHLS